MLLLLLQLCVNINLYPGGNWTVCSTSYHWCRTKSAGWKNIWRSGDEQGFLDHFESYVEIQEHEDDTREEEAARQKEFLEKVVISQKGQLRQLEKVGKISDGQW